MRERVRVVLLPLALGVMLLGVAAKAQEPPPKSDVTAPAAASQDDIRGLRELVTELNARMDRIEQQAGMPAAAPATGAAQPSEIEELRQQVYELNKRLRQIEVQAETDKAAADEKAKKTPVVNAGPDGFGFASPDKAFQLKVSGRVAYDTAFFNQSHQLRSAVGDEQDGTGFPYARLQLSGRAWNYLKGVFELDFAGENGQDTPQFREVYMSIDGIPYGGGRDFELCAGHYREPFSMEELTSVVYRPFNERSLANVFAPSYNAGLMIRDALLGEPKSERLTWAIGAFKEVDNWPSGNDSDEDQGYQVTARVTGLPIYAEDGRKLLHLGAAYSLRNPDGAVVNYGARPDSRLALFRYVSVDNLPAGFRLRDARAEDVNLLDLELAGVYGPFWMGTEYIHSSVDTTFGGSLDFDGYYVQGGYFLTGENRPYRNDNATWARVAPKHNFGWKSTDGWGAWELAARYSSVDLNDGIVRGGVQSSLTFGVNWYLNPNARITCNYSINDVDHDLYDGDLDIFQTRFQFEF